MESRLRELEGIFNRLRAMQYGNGTCAIQQSPVKDNSSAKVHPDSFEVVQQLRQEIARMEHTLREYKQRMEALDTANSALRSNERELRNAVLKAKGAIRVLCRMKPSNALQNIRYGEMCIEIDQKKFVLDRVFDQRSTQEELFMEIRSEIQSILDGYNVCVFAYGQTGSGKTYTMEGPVDDRGLLFRSLREINDVSRSMTAEGFSVVFSVKYLEVYNESIKDLIQGGPVAISHDHDSIKLKNCSEVLVPNIQDVESVIEDACSKRRTSRTICNDTSSRSHSIFVLKVLAERENERREGALCLIDLAGSERLDESRAEGERLKETKFINKSLSALGNVISALKRKDRHVPFRDSKLTHLMQEYLTGTSRVSMIVNVNPENVGETICSLRFATKVSECNSGAVSRNITRTA